MQGNLSIKPFTWVSTNVYINEHLTKLHSSIFAKARSLVREKKIIWDWTAEGMTLVLQTNALNEKSKTISSMKDLEDLGDV